MALFCLPFHHTLTRLQPFDKSVYGPFKAYFNKAIENWLRNNPDELVRIGHISQLVKSAMINSMTPKNIISGFEKAGIYPLNTEIFQESDFVAAELTDRPYPSIDKSPLAVERQPSTSTSKVFTIGHDGAPTTSQSVESYVSPSQLFP